ncbi:hypothetical protein TRICI_001286 [Trichomonascus ciferrii]|uniref:N-acetyltransferase domain-containing protein n=1 Tax=Trichomonascus ciferrii TaxID=44093 RepID=A0A642V8V4_9ASCO|nr:hypothetical protein TRICI_001286 [Trichomonascus ciferrii]
MTTGEIEYRYGQVGDANDIASLGAHVFYVSFSKLMPAEDLRLYLRETYSIANISVELEDPLNVFIVAVKNNHIVGFAQLTLNASEPCIDHVESKIQLNRLYVSDNHQGLGIGKALMIKAENEARKRGIENIWLASWEKNTEVERIYKKAGYTKTGSMKFMLGSTQLKDWVMIKSL